jgi:hypothetical protein
MRFRVSIFQQTITTIFSTTRNEGISVENAWDGWRGCTPEPGMFNKEGSLLGFLTIANGFLSGRISVVLL